MTSPQASPLRANPRPSREDRLLEARGRGRISRANRFEHEITFRNIASGEQVSWLPRRQTTDLALPGNDFWLIDGQLLVVHHFSGEGDFVDDEISTDPQTMKLSHSAFEAVWERAVPHEDFQLQGGL
ncbi:DUF6879 family protein [Kitasatospora sp. NPDC058243]|uniref:DUF6879 family protein n=1 Tax=Kitasatospora sp. NPDC058243 TaxID=3346397 RepID=UPI0036D87182